MRLCVIDHAHLRVALDFRLRFVSGSFALVSESALDGAWLVSSGLGVGHDASSVMATSV